jgi:hypothetical protein
VIAARAGGVLSRADYLALGVRQSIFPVDARERLYDLFDKYRAVAGRGRPVRPRPGRAGLACLAAPRYDFVVVDEVQDLTPPARPGAGDAEEAGHFLLCGDRTRSCIPTSSPGAR